MPGTDAARGPSLETSAPGIAPLVDAVAFPGEEFYIPSTSATSFCQGQLRSHGENAPPGR
jgi:hypothetical protein